MENNHNMKKDLTLLEANNSYYLKPISRKADITKQDDCDGYLINTQGDEKEARKIVDVLKRKDRILAIVGSDNIFNRRVLETLKINYLVSPEKEDKKDNLKQRDSGLNHVTAKIAKEKKISIIINFSELKELKPKQLVIRLERIIQNIKICRRVNAQIKIATFANNKQELVDSKTLQEFMISLGASTQQAKEATRF